MKFFPTLILASVLFLPFQARADETDSAPSIGLHLAALQGNVDAVRQHIAAGTDLNRKDAYGSTPLIIAVTFGKTDVAQALIEAGAGLTIPNNSAATPLHVAAFFCHTEIVKSLLHHGADKRVRDQAGNTPYDSVAAPFDKVKAVYENIAKGLAPLGMRLDYERIKATRPIIAEMLRPTAEELGAVKYAPLPGGDWPVSTPAAQGLEPKLLSELYWDAGGLTTLFGLLVIKDDHLIAEAYFNGKTVDERTPHASVTKSVTSALVGVALERGCLSSVDQKMIDFFPEFAEKLADPRKETITIRELLQMRGGYPWEEREPPYQEKLFVGGNWHYVPHVVDFPLSSDPGSDFRYSNLTSHILGVIVARACQTDLQTDAQENVFAPIGGQVGEWYRDADGYNFGCFGIHLTARDMARFGSLYFHGGEYNGKRVLPAEWVRGSLRRYSEAINFSGTEGSEAGRHFRDLGYGYQWWSARVGDHHFDYAWGHGGNLIVLLHDLDMMIVTSADPLSGKTGDESWRFEGPIINTVGKFIAALPAK